MKAEATIEDYQKRDRFLIKYCKSQIKKLEDNYAKYGREKDIIKSKPYKDILFKLEKDGTIHST